MIDTPSSNGAEPTLAEPATIPHWKTRLGVAKRVRALLVERFPLAFKGPGEAKPPLMIGISAEILLRCPDIARLELHWAMNDYCGGSTYLRSFIEGAQRLDLDGTPVTPVTQGEIQNAHLRLRAKMAAYERRQEKHAVTQAQQWQRDHKAEPVGSGPSE